MDVPAVTGAWTTVTWICVGIALTQYSDCWSSPAPSELRQDIYSQFYRGEAKIQACLGHMGALYLKQQVSPSQHVLSRLSFNQETQLKKTTWDETGVQECWCTFVGFSAQPFCALLPGTVKAAAEPGDWSGAALGSLKSPVENSHGYSMGMLTPLLVVQELGLKFKIVMPIIGVSYCTCCLWTGCSNTGGRKTSCVQGKSLASCSSGVQPLLNSCTFCIPVSSLQISVKRRPHLPKVPPVGEDKVG